MDDNWFLREDLVLLSRTGYDPDYRWSEVEITKEKMHFVKEASMTENEKSQEEVKRVIGETFTLKSGNNAPDPRALLAKHDEQRERAEREAKPSPIITSSTDKKQ